MSDDGGVPLLIIGAGGHGRETLDVVEAMFAAGDRTHRFVGFAADAAQAELLERRRAALLGSGSDAIDLVREHDAAFHIAIGSSQTRARIDDGFRAAGLGGRAATLVHPAATLGADNDLGPGLFLAAGARITTNVRVGRFAQLNVNAVLSHDVVAGDHVTVSPGALVNGNAVLGDRVFLGTGAIVLPGRTIGDDAIIAAGAVVERDVPPGVTAIGVPARW